MKKALFLFTLFITQSHASQLYENGDLPSICIELIPDILHLSNKYQFEHPQIILSIILRESECHESAHNTTSNARGLGQFTPIAIQQLQLISPKFNDFDPFNGTQSIRAIIFYLEWLKERITTNYEVTSCNQWAMILSAYNGGIGNLHRDVSVCNQNSSCNSSEWFNNIENHTRRSDAARNENRQFVDQILNEYEPLIRNEMMLSHGLC